MTGLPETRRSSGYGRGHPQKAATEDGENISSEEGYQRSAGHGVPEDRAKGGSSTVGCPIFQKFRRAVDMVAVSWIRR